MAAGHCNAHDTKQHLWCAYWRPSYISRRGWAAQPCSSLLPPWSSLGPRLHKCRGTDHVLKYVDLQFNSAKSYPRCKCIHKFEIWNRPQRKRHIFHMHALQAAAFTCWCL